MITKLFYTVQFILLIIPSTNLSAGLPSNEKLDAVRKEGQKLIANYFSVKNGNGKCMTIDKKKRKTPGTEVKSFSCTKQGNQLWKLDGARVRFSTGLCLQPSGNGSKVGEILQIALCDNSAKQNWVYENTLLKTASKLCVEVTPQDVSKEGGRIMLAPCNGKAHQQWKPE